MPTGQRRSGRDRRPASGVAAGAPISRRQPEQRIGDLGPPGSAGSPSSTASRPAGRWRRPGRPGWSGAVRRRAAALRCRRRPAPTARPRVRRCPSSRTQRQLGRRRLPAAAWYRRRPIDRPAVTARSNPRYTATVCPGGTVDQDGWRWAGRSGRPRRCGTLPPTAPPVGRGSSCSAALRTVGRTETSSSVSKTTGRPPAGSAGLRLGAGRHGRPRPGTPEVKVRYVRAGRRRVAGDAQQVEEGEVVLLRRLVEPVDDALAQPGEQLDQRDPEVAGVVVGPLPARSAGSAHASGRPGPARSGRRGPAGRSGRGATPASSGTLQCEREDQQMLPARWPAAGR